MSITPSLCAHKRHFACFNRVNPPAAVQKIKFDVSGDGQCQVTATKGGQPAPQGLKLQAGVGNIVEVCSNGPGPHYFTCATLASAGDVLPPASSPNSSARRRTEQHCAICMQGRRPLPKLCLPQGAELIRGRRGVGLCVVRHAPRVRRQERRVLRGIHRARHARPVPRK